MKKSKVILLIMLIFDAMLIAAAWTLCIIGTNYDLDNLSKAGNAMWIIGLCILIVITCLQYCVLKKDRKLKQENNNGTSHK